MTRDQVITTIREALEAGPYEGPWTVEEFQNDGRPCALIVSAGGTIIAEIRGYIDSCGNGENARFIAAVNPQNVAVLLAALQSAAETPAPQTHLRAYPQELTDDLRDILSMMMWNTGPIAHALRDGGQDIKRKAEEEQAEVMHWLIGLALEHGSEWRAKASDRIREIRDALAATATEGGHG